MTLRWLEYFYSSQWEKKNICCPLSEALALGRQPESLLVRTRHTAPRIGAPTASAGGQGPGTACLLSEGTGDSPSPVRQGQGTALPHSAGARDSLSPLSRGWGQPAFLLPHPALPGSPQSSPKFSLEPKQGPCGRPAWGKGEESSGSLRHLPDRRFPFPSVNKAGGGGRPLGTGDCASEEGSAGPGVPCGAGAGAACGARGRRGRQGGRTARGLVSRTSRPYFVSSGWGLYYVSASNKVETRKPL